MLMELSDFADIDPDWFSEYTQESDIAKTISSKLLIATMCDVSSHY
jgi:hypothetical protein